HHIEQHHAARRVAVRQPAGRLGSVRHHPRARVALQPAHRRAPQEPVLPGAWQDRRELDPDPVHQPMPDRRLPDGIAVLGRPAALREHRRVERVRIAGPTGANSYGFWITGDAGAATDVVTFKNVVVQGNTGTAHSTHGLIVDGRVNTLSAYKLYLNEMDGAGLWFRNTMGSADPEFATFYGLGIERPFFEAVQIAV